MIEKTDGNRDPRGRFLHGAPAGPGRGRKRPPSPAEETLYGRLRATVNEVLEEAEDVGMVDVVGALARLLARARDLRRQQISEATPPAEKSPEDAGAAEALRRNG